MNISSIEPSIVFEAFDINTFDRYVTLETLKKPFVIIDRYSVSDTRIEYSFNTFNELRSQMDKILSDAHSDSVRDPFKDLDVVVFQSAMYLVYFLNDFTFSSSHIVHFRGID